MGLYRRNYQIILFLLFLFLLCAFANEMRGESAIHYFNKQGVSVVGPVNNANIVTLEMARNVHYSLKEETSFHIIAMNEGFYHSLIIKPMELPVLNLGIPVDIVNNRKIRNSDIYNLFKLTFESNQNPISFFNDLSIETTGELFSGTLNILNIIKELMSEESGTISKLKKIVCKDQNYASVSIDSNGYVLETGYDSGHNFSKITTKTLKELLVLTYDEVESPFFIFSKMGIRCLGNIDSHNLELVYNTVEVLQNLVAEREGFFIKEIIFSRKKEFYLELKNKDFFTMVLGYFHPIVDNFKIRKKDIEELAKFSDLSEKNNLFNFYFKKDIRISGKINFTNYETLQHIKYVVEKNKLSLKTLQEIKVSFERGLKISSIGNSGFLAEVGIFRDSFGAFLNDKDIYNLLLLVE